MFCSLQIRIGAHGLNPTTQGLKGLVPVWCACVHACMCVVDEPGASLLAFLLALQMITQWVDLAAAGRTLSSFGVSSLVGWMALSSSLTCVPSAIQRQDSMIPSLSLAAAMCSPCPKRESSHCGALDGPCVRTCHCLPPQPAFSWEDLYVVWKDIICTLPCMCFRKGILHMASMF